MSRLPLPSHECFMTECGRQRGRVTDLLCPEHWRLIPKHMKQSMLDANKLRSWQGRRDASIKAGSAIVAYLKSLQIQLPPAMKLERIGDLVVKPGAEDLKIGPLVKHEKTEIETPKLIIP